MQPPFIALSQYPLDDMLSRTKGAGMLYGTQAGIWLHSFLGITTHRLEACQRMHHGSSSRTFAGKVTQLREPLNMQHKVNIASYAFCVQRW
jgi:hypothetical protein